MKKKLVVPRLSVATLITGIIFIGLWYIVDKLEGLNYYFCIGTLNIELIYFIILCLGFALVICSVALLLFKNLKRKWIAFLIAAILVSITVPYLSLTLWSYNIMGNQLVEITSDDGKHNIVIVENSFLHGGSGHIFEKTSAFTMRKIGNYSTNHTFNPVKKGEYFIEWNENDFVLHYNGHSSDAYEILKTEYLK